jgi:hypothetical protein
MLRPKILLPEHLAESLPEPALRAALLHEASHVRRNDLVANTFQKIVEVVFWWNPIIRWMGSTLDAAREIACDVKASRSCENPADYAEALLTAVEHIAIPRAVRFAAALGMSGSQVLDQRIECIIEERSSGAPARMAAIGALLVLAAVCVAACAVSRPLRPVPARPPEPSSIASIAPVVAQPSPEARDEGPPAAASAPAQAAPTTVDVADVRARHLAYVSAQEAKHLAYVAASEAKHRAYVESSAAKHREYVQAMSAEPPEPATTEAIRLEYAVAMERERREYAADAERERREYATDAERERREHGAAMEIERREHSAAMEAKRREQNAAREAERRAMIQAGRGRDPTAEATK